MANNQNGRGVHRTDENRPSWRPQDQDYEERRFSRDDVDDRDLSDRDRAERYGRGADEGRGRRDDEPSRWSVIGRNWEDDRDEGYHGTERYGQGQSGYGAGRYADDRSQGYMNRNTRGAGRQSTEDREGMATDDRWTGRGGQGYWEDRDDRQRDFGGYDRTRGDYNSGYNQGSIGYGGYGESTRPNVGSPSGFRGGSGGAQMSGGRGFGGEASGYGRGPGMGASGYYGQGHEGRYDQRPDTYGQGMTGQGGPYGPYGYGGGQGGPGGPSHGGYGAQGEGQGHSGGYAQGGPGMQNLQGVQAGMPQGGPFGRGMGHAQAGHAGHAGHAGQGPSTGMHRGKGPQGYTRSDDRIREIVCEALTDDDHVDASNIEVTVENGEVTLTGSVEDRYTKRMAEDVVERCTGVKDVHNQLRVQGGDPKRGPGNQTGNSAVGRTETDTNPTLTADKDKDKKPRA